MTIPHEKTPGPAMSVKSDLDRRAIAMTSSEESK